MASTDVILQFSEGDLCINRILHLWEKDDYSYREWLPQSFAQLLNPDISTEYLSSWITDLQTFLTSVYDASINPDHRLYLLIYPLLLEFLDAGMVVTLFEISHITEDAVMSACFRALNAFANLIGHTAYMNHPEEVCSRVTGSGGLEAMLQTIRSGGSFHKVAAIGCLHRVFSRSHCHESFTAGQISDLITACCSYHLNGYQHALEEWKNPLSLLSQELEFKIDDTPDRDDDQLRVWFARNQEDALEVCLFVFKNRKRPITRKFSLEIIHQSPAILDSLLRIACEARPSWYLTRVTDSISASIIVNLMGLPPDVIPGVPEVNSGEWDAALRCNEILHSRPNALEMIIFMRTKVLEEDMVLLTGKLVDPRWESEKISQLCKILFCNRATLLVTSLRLLVNLTYLESAPPPLLLALLPFSYVTCGRIPSEAECFSAELADEDQLVLLTRMKDGVFELELRCEHCDDQSGYPPTAFIASVSTLGPTLLFRALCKLSQAGFGLEKLQKLKSLPPGVPAIPGCPTYLAHIHQIVTSKIMGKLIRMSVNRRIPGCRNLGRDKLLDDKPDGAAKRCFATATFMAAAELALAISALERYTPNTSIPIFQENWSSVIQANQEVILCVGNAAEAAGRTGQWGAASKLAKFAVEFGNTICDEEAEAIGWDIALTREKNMNRLNIATKRAMF